MLKPLSYYQGPMWDIQHMQCWLWDLHVIAMLSLHWPEFTISDSLGIAQKYQFRCIDGWLYRWTSWRLYILFNSISHNFAGQYTLPSVCPKYLNSLRQDIEHFSIHVLLIMEFQEDRASPVKIRFCFNNNSEIIFLISL